MNSSKHKKRQRNYVASLLCCHPKELEYLCDNIRSYYSKWIENKTDETGKPKTYKDGTPKKRVIRPSHKRLKEIQKALKINILSKIPLPANIHGGVKKKSNATNANAHKGKKYRFTTDLKDFFPGIKSPHIYSMFLQLGFSNEAANLLTKLTSVEFELPQGTPTSTHIANLVFLPTDLLLIELCNENNITYTRFVDDLSFSSQINFADELNKILQIVLKAGYKINYRKTKYKGDQPITKLDVYNNYINTPKRINELASQEDKSASIRPYNAYRNYVRKFNSTKLKQKEAKVI